MCKKILKQLEININSAIDCFIFLQALGIFGLCQIHAFVDYLRYRLTPSYFEILFKSLVIISATVAGIIGAILTITGKVSANLLYLLCIPC